MITLGSTMAARSHYLAAVINRHERRHSRDKRGPPPPPPPSPHRPVTTFFQFRVDYLAPARNTRPRAISAGHFMPRKTATFIGVACIASLRREMHRNQRARNDSRVRRLSITRGTWRFSFRIYDPTFPVGGEARNDSRLHNPASRQRGEKEKIPSKRDARAMTTVARDYDGFGVNRHTRDDHAAYIYIYSAIYIF
jgi:hypothetical protein